MTHRLTKLQSDVLRLAHHGIGMCYMKPNARRCAWRLVERGLLRTHRGKDGVVYAHLTNHHIHPVPEHLQDRMHELRARR